MSNQIKLTGAYIKNLTPLKIATDEIIGDHFVTKYMAMYRTNKEQAIAFYEREKDNFMTRISESEALRECTPMSIFLAFMQVGGWKLSFEGGSQSDVYLIPGNRKTIITDEKGQKHEKWIKEVSVQPSPYGEKKIRIETGQVKHVGSPTVVYDCDTYKEYTAENGRNWVEFEKGTRTSKSKITNGFILLEYPDGSKEFKTFDLDDVASWERASAKKNKGHANALYGYDVTYENVNGRDVKKSTKVDQIDKKFFEGKILKHAFKLLPRVIAAAPLPENFTPIGEESIRQGFDTSEFTEDTTYEDVSEKETDDFEKELEQQSETEPEKTVVISSNEDDEPEF